MSTDPKTEIDLRLLPKEDRIDVICDLFESQWVSGQQPTIRSYLGMTDAQEQANLFSELLLVEMEFLQNRGEQISKKDYLKAYPEFVVEIESIHFRHGIDSTFPSLARDGSSHATPQENQLTHFQLEEKIGSGAAGVVWKARDLRLQRTVALKIPHQSHLSADELRRFEREAQSVAQLRHPNIVRIYEVGREGKAAFIVSEYICGLNLREWLQQNSLSERDSADLCAKIAGALQHAHEQGVVHRDLKPANILMDEQGTPHIADFGLAKWIKDEHHLTIEGELLGTPAYMSPEQARGETSRVNHKSDLYSLGIILFELLTGKLPFRGDQAVVITAVIQDAPPAPRRLRRSLPRDIEKICLKAIEKLPQNRYDSAQQFADDLRRFSRGEPVRARRPGRSLRAWYWAKRRPWRSSAVLLAALSMISITGAWIVAEQNRTLLGLRTIRIATEPVGAKVAFVPINKNTGEPVPSKLIRANSVSPVSLELAAGDYLVIAYFDRGRHQDRFHEVYRHVPTSTESLPGNLSHLRWKLDESDSIVLPRIKIPERSVTSEMAYIDPETKSASEAIYVDLTEFTIAQHRKLYHNDPPESYEWSDRPLDFPVTLSWDQATQVAERVGKRLPTEGEFQFLLSQLSKHVSSNTLEERLGTVGPVGSIKADCLAFSKPVFGLASNVAEWTQTSGSAPRVQNHAKFQLGSHMLDTRIVCGGTIATIEDEDSMASFNETSSARIVLPRYTVRPGLGFRCVRSARPRYVESDQ